MKRLLLLILLEASLSSCMTTKRIQRHCEDFAQLCGTDQVTTVYRDTVIYKHDTIRVTLPRDTVRLTDTVTVMQGIASMPKITDQHGVITAESWVDHNLLFTNAWLNDSTLLQQRTDTIRLPGAIKHEIVTKTLIKKERYIPKLHKWALTIMLIELLAVGIWLWFRFGLGGKFKTLLTVIVKLFKK